MATNATVSVNRCHHLIDLASGQAYERQADQKDEESDEQETAENISTLSFLKLQFFLLE